MDDISDLNYTGLLKKFWVVIPAIIILFAVMISLIKQGPAPDMVLGYANEAVLILIGIYLFFRGFVILNKKALIEDIPTSTIRSAAMGLCEVAGTAKQQLPIKAPITSTDCVYYRYLVEREEYGYRGRPHWVTMNGGCSPGYFYIEDETGKLLINPAGAEVILPVSYCSTDDSYGYNRRCTEWRIKPGDRIFILGTVSKIVDIAVEHQRVLNERLNELAKDKELMKACDTDGDGRISTEEWAAARARVEQVLNEEEAAVRPQHSEEDIAITKGDSGMIFIISEKSEKELRAQLGASAYWNMILGLLMVAVFLVSLFARAGYFPDRFAIPWWKLYNEVLEGTRYF